MVLRNIVFSIEETLRQASEKDPPGDMFLSEIRKIVYSLVPEDQRKISQDDFNHRVGGILGKLKEKKYVIHTTKKGEEPRYRLNVDHPNVQRWIEKKWYEKGITIDGFSYYD